MKEKELHCAKLNEERVAYLRRKNEEDERYAKIVSEESLYVENKK